jgi:hypothetical protein
MSCCYLMYLLHRTIVLAGAADRLSGIFSGQMSTSTSIMTTYSLTNMTNISMATPAFSMAVSVNHSYNNNPQQVKFTGFLNC